MDADRSNPASEINRWRFPDIIKALRDRCARYAGGAIPEGCTCDRCQAVDELAALRAERDMYRNASNRAAAEVERMRPVVEAAERWRDAKGFRHGLFEAVDTYREACK